MKTGTVSKGAFTSLEILKFIFLKRNHFLRADQFGVFRGTGPCSQQLFCCGLGDFRRNQPFFAFRRILKSNDLFFIDPSRFFKQSDSTVNGFMWRSGSFRRSMIS